MNMGLCGSTIALSLAVVACAPPAREVELPSGTVVAVRLDRAVFVDAGAGFLPSTDLATKLAGMDSRPWGDWRGGKPISLLLSMSPCRCDRS